ncbi:MAG: response regulator [Chloroflexota bacterium]
MSQTILIVDDDEMTRRVLRLYCLRNGFEVFEAEDGQQALTLIENKCPNLVIMDVLMPVMDGFTTVRNIRTKLDCAALPILFLTSRADSKAKNTGLEMGAQRFLNKPINLGELVKVIKELLTESWVIKEAQ